MDDLDCQLTYDVGCAAKERSLACHRGASSGKAGDRCREMRELWDHMQGADVAAIPQDIRAMKRFWPTVPGVP